MESCDTKINIGLSVITMGLYDGTMFIPVGFSVQI